MWQDIKNIYHLFQAIIANIINGFPSRDLIIIGVTGTDGKTTTSSLIYHILNSAGVKVALITSVSAIINGKSYDTGFHVTTPDPFSVQSYLKKAKDAGVKYVILETTSIGLHQLRVFGVKFEIGVLTNITNEHLDYHKNYASLVKAKSMLFKKSKVSIINRDDKSYEFIFPLIKNKKIITYGMKRNSDVNPLNFPFETNLIGEFNIYNTLAAVATTHELGINQKKITKSLLTFKAPIGREEIVYDKEFKIMIDFAHTPGSFEAILPSLKKLNPNRIIHVFGSAGLRDKYKRPLMGKISSLYSDIIILTAEDPRNESPEKISKEIEKGIDPRFNKKNLYKISDRQEAINKAVKLAHKNDLIVITGKAQEASMNYGQGEIPWSEHETVKKALKLNNK